MSGMSGCLTDLLAKGVIDEEMASRLAAQEAADMAQGKPATETTKLFMEAISRQQQLAIRQAGMINTNINLVMSHPQGPRAGFEALLARDLYEVAGQSNVYNRKNAIERTATGMMAEAIDAMRVRAGGLAQDHKMIRDIARALHGEKVDPEAQRLAKLVADTMEYLRVRFNNAGGNIPHNPKWGLPHSHNGVAVRDATFEGWFAFIEPLLDRSAMKAADGLAFTDEAFKEAMQHAYQSIVTQGLNKLTPGQIVGRKLANTRQDHRFLIFKNADDWLTYDAKYGSGNPFHAINHHVREMSADIALLEIMGPSPNHMFRVLRDSIAIETGNKEGFAVADSLWAVVAGAGQTTGAMSIRTVENLNEIRAVITATRLGSAIISTMSDQAFLAMTAGFNGLSVVRTYQNYLRLLNPANAEDRLFAARLGLVFDSATYFAAAGNRFGDATGTGIGARLADIMMRWSGMTAHTEAAQRAIGLDWMIQAAQYRKMDFGSIPPAFRRIMDEVGLDEAGWNIIRNAPIEKSTSGVEAINMVALANRGDPDATAAVSKALEAIDILTHFAVPMPDAHTKAFNARWFGPQGSRSREILGKSVMQFKAFPVAVAYSHLSKLLYGSGSFQSKMGYAAALFIGTTVMGALAVQAHEIARGRTPRDVWDKDFWGRAMLQGGGAGIYGDVINAAVFKASRYGGSPLEMVAGPLPGAVIEALQATTGQLGGLVQGEDPQIARDLVQFAGRNTPILSSLWYAKTAYDRMIINQLEMMVDREAEIRWRRAERRMSTERGNEPWWRKGEMLPEPVKDAIDF